MNTSQTPLTLESSSPLGDGPNCSTVQDPPGIYASTFSTGAISGTSNALQSFSSRGAVTSDFSNRMKPDISAPGASVRSTLRTSTGTGADVSYGNMSGTSMAGPHVAGVVALLWSARPNLVRDMPRTKYLLTRSANPAVTVPNNSAGCGGIATVPNNHFGWGRVDALAAYNLEPSLNQTITFPAIAAFADPASSSDKANGGGVRRSGSADHARRGNVQVDLRRPTPTSRTPSASASRRRRRRSYPQNRHVAQAACKASQADAGFAAAHGGKTFAQFYGPAVGRQRAQDASSQAGRGWPAQSAVDARREAAATKTSVDGLQGQRHCRMSKRRQLRPSALGRAAEELGARGLAALHPPV